MDTSVTPMVCVTLALGLGRGRSSCCAEPAAASWKTSRAAAGTAARAMSFLILLSFRYSMESVRAKWNPDLCHDQARPLLEPGGAAVEYPHSSPGVHARRSGPW